MRESVEGRPLDERELIESAQSGDTRAFEELVRIHQGVALRVAYVVVRDASEAEDVTQNAFVKAYRSLDGFRVGASFRPWLLSIVRNEALNRVRSTKRRDALALRTTKDLASGDAAPSPEAEVISRDEGKRLLTLIDALPERYRAIIVHRYLLDLSEDETSRVLGIPRGTVKSRGSRALRRLRRSLSIEYEDST